MNKHLRALRNLSYIIIAALYGAWVPAQIVHYGMEHHPATWGAGIAPFYEVYSVTLLAWLVGHAGTLIALYVIYNLCYGMYKE